MTPSPQIKSNPNPKLSLALGLTWLGIIVSLVALYEHVIYSNGLATGPSFCNIFCRWFCFVYQNF